MKKSFFLIAILLGLFSVVLSSCGKDDDDPSTVITEASATYNLIMEGNIVAEGTSTNKVLMFDNTLNMGGAGSDLVITITNVPETIGGDIAINKSSGTNGENCQVQVGGNNLLQNGADESYYGTSGTVTRTSATKISFEGIVQDGASGPEYTFSGYVESDAYIVN